MTSSDGQSRTTMEQDPDNHEPDPLRRRYHTGWRVHVSRDLRGGRVPRRVLERLLRRVGRGEKAHGEVRLIVIDDRRMRRLNREFRNIDRPTDVLSFPHDPSFPGPGDTEIVGEIYCSMDHCRRWSREHDGTMTAELARLAVHGCLHLLGYDHATEAEREIMTQRENRYLRDAGLIATRDNPGNGHAG